MVARCEKPTHHAYRLYGGRGISITPELRTFEGFYAVLGARPKGTSLERIDVNGNYSPENVRWADIKTQQRNRRSNRLITLNGETRCLSEWSELLGIPYDRISARLLRYGWSIEKAMQTDRYERGDPQSTEWARYEPAQRSTTVSEHIDKRRTHGMAKTREYRCWKGMITRCENPCAKDRELYGGRGIKIASEIRSFEGFYKLLGPRPPGMSLDRIDVNGDYAPGNLRWADPKTQARNRRSSHLITHNGKTQTVTEWAEELNIPNCRLRMRLHCGWSIERALTPGKFNPGGTRLV